MYLLDTDHFVHLMQARSTVVQRLAAVGRGAVATSVIVRGELLYIARISALRAENLASVSTLLQGITIWPVDEESGDVYADIKAALLDRFGPKERARRRQFDLRQLGFGDNDLWIAAIAIQRGLTVVSADADFGRIAQVTLLAVETWWSPRDAQAPS